MSDRSGTFVLGAVIVGGLGYAVVPDNKQSSEPDYLPPPAQFSAADIYGAVSTLPDSTGEKPLVPDLDLDAETLNALNALGEESTLLSGPRGAYAPSYGSGYQYGLNLDDEEEDEDRPEFNVDDAIDAAEREMALRGYDMRYGCTIDCSGHQAGWDWRAQNGFPTYGNVTGYGDSLSFGEGARAYEEAVKDRVQEIRDDYDMGIDYPY